MMLKMFSCFTNESNVYRSESLWKNCSKPISFCRSSYSIFKSSVYVSVIILFMLLAVRDTFEI